MVHFRRLSDAGFYLQIIMWQTTVFLACEEFCKLFNNQGRFDPVAGDRQQLLASEPNIFTIMKVTTVFSVCLFLNGTPNTQICLIKNVPTSISVPWLYPSCPVDVPRPEQWVTLSRCLCFVQWVLPGENTPSAWLYPPVITFRLMGGTTSNYDRYDG